MGKRYYPPISTQRDETFAKNVINVPRSPVPNPRRHASDGSKKPKHLHRAGGYQRPFFSRFSAFFSAGVLSGFFLVCFWEFCDLAMIVLGLEKVGHSGLAPAKP
jgi:hypothetical protein